MDRVSVVTPTFNRTEPLARALASLLAQRGLEELEVELIVVDNSPDRNAKSAVTAMAQDAPFPLHYVSEPRPGVANARNAGVAAATGRWIAFLDDDEEAASDWLASLVRVARETGADAVFGPIEAKAEGGGEIGAFAPYFERSVSRCNLADITDLAAYLGTNNSMFDRLGCLGEQENFDLRLNESGGEDSLLLQRLVLAGKIFRFAADAHVVEWAPRRRLNWSYVKKRKFASGQIRVFVQAMARQADGRTGDRLAIARWMAVGLVQSAIFGATTLLLTPLGEERRERMAARLHAGLGKVFWAPRFRLALYGRGHVS